MGAERYPDIQIGTRFGQLTFISYDRLKEWSFLLCDCNRGVRVRTGDLRKGRTVSCGCVRTARIIRYSTKHGACDSPEYQSWRGMKERVSNPHHENYEYYGERGITVASEWTGEDGFQRFLEHIGPKPLPEYSLDRIDTNGNYEPGNVRWASPVQQANNRRRRRWGKRPQANA